MTLDSFLTSPLLCHAELTLSFALKLGGEKKERRKEGRKEQRVVI